MDTTRPEPDPDHTSDDQAIQRAERGARGRQAKERAAQAGVRAAELRRQHAAAAAGEDTHGSSPGKLTSSRRHADDAAERFAEAVERAAVAHDRAALLHEQRAAAGDDDRSAGQDEHADQAHGHRLAAAADRELGRQAEHRRDAHPDLS